MRERDGRDTLERLLDVCVPGVGGVGRLNRSLARRQLVVMMRLALMVVLSPFVAVEMDVGVLAADVMMDE